MPETFRTLVEELKPIYSKGNKLQWNPNKTEKEFKKRIKDRTRLTNNEFYEKIQDAINELDTKIKNVTCIYFIQSKFVLILDSTKIITVRDGKWDKPSNGNCEALMVFEDSDSVEIFNIFDNKMLHNGYELIMTENKNELLVKHSCSTCLKYKG